MAKSPMRKMVDSVRSRLSVSNEQNIATNLNQQMIIKSKQEEQAFEDALLDLSDGDVVGETQFDHVSEEQKEALAALNQMVRLYQAGYVVHEHNIANPVASIKFDVDDVFDNKHFKADMNQLHRQFQATLSNNLSKNISQKMHRQMKEMVQYASKSEAAYDQAVEQSYGSIERLLTEQQHYQQEAMEQGLALSKTLQENVPEFYKLPSNIILESIDDETNVFPTKTEAEVLGLKEAHETFMKQSPYYEEHAVNQLSPESLNQAVTKSATNVITSTFQLAESRLRSFDDTTNDNEIKLLEEAASDAYDTRKESLRDVYLLSKQVTHPLTAETIVRTLDVESEKQVFDLVSESIRTGADLTAMAMPGLSALSSALDPVYDGIDAKLSSGSSGSRVDFVGSVKKVAKPEVVQHVVETEEERLRRMRMLEADTPLQMPEL